VYIDEKRLPRNWGRNPSSPQNGYLTNGVFLDRGYYYRYGNGQGAQKIISRRFRSTYIFDPILPLGLYVGQNCQVRSLRLFSVKDQFVTIRNVIFAGLDLRGGRARAPGLPPNPSYIFFRS